MWRVVGSLVSVVPAGWAGLTVPVVHGLSGSFRLPSCRPGGMGRLTVCAATLSPYGGGSTRVVTTQRVRVLTRTFQPFCRFWWWLHGGPWFDRQEPFGPCPVGRSALPGCPSLPRSIAI